MYLLKSPDRFKNCCELLCLVSDVSCGKQILSNVEEVAHYRGTAIGQSTAPRMNTTSLMVRPRTDPLPFSQVATTLPFLLPL